MDYSSTRAQLEAADTPHIEVNEVRKEYESRGGRVLALDAVSLKVRRGEVVALIGKSGCGKSTLLKMVLGVVPLSQGFIAIAGEHVRGPRSDVGMVFQTPALPPWRTVLKNVLLPIEALSLPVRDYLPRARALLALVGLSDFEETYPQELS